MTRQDYILYIEGPTNLRPRHLFVYFGGSYSTKSSYFHLPSWVMESAPDNYLKVAATTEWIVWP